MKTQEQDDLNATLDVKLIIYELCKTRTFALGDKPHSFFAPEGKPPRRGLNPRPLSHVVTTSSSARKTVMSMGSSKLYPSGSKYTTNCNLFIVTLAYVVLVLIPCLPAKYVQRIIARHPLFSVLDTVQNEKSRARNLVGRARGRVREDGNSGRVANEGNGRGRGRIGPGGRTGGPEVEGVDGINT
nr:hypothetical protein [Tanacetum cinerariifolium]